jgi:hypothetical protein
MVWIHRVLDRLDADAMNAYPQVSRIWQILQLTLKERNKIKAETAALFSLGLNRFRDLPRQGKPVDRIKRHVGNPPKIAASSAAKLYVMALDPDSFGAAAHNNVA